MDPAPAATQITSDGGRLRVHRRQLVIGPRAWAPYDHWKTVRLGSVTLSHCPDLRVAEILDADGGRWVLVGLAVQTRPDAPAPVEEIAQTSTAGVPELRHDWCGRWLLVSEHRVQADAAASLGCLLSRDADGSPWLSSSPVLLSRLCGNEWQSFRPRYQYGTQWFPAPGCCLVGATRLLPGLPVDPRTGETSVCRLLPEIPRERDEAWLLDELAARFRTAMANVPGDRGPLWLGLSAGGDSRVIFAAAVAAGREIRPFSWVAGRTKLCDRLIPPLLAERVGMEHVSLATGKIDPARRRLVLEHAGPSLSTGDAVPVLRGARLGLTGLCTGGQCFDAWKASSFARFPDDVSDPIQAGRHTARFYLERAGSFPARAFAAWYEHLARTPEPGMDYRDRWHLEQGTPGWQSPKEQLYEMQMLERFAIPNGGTLTALMLALPLGPRRDQAYYPELVQRLAPQIADIPLNPSEASLVGPMRAGLISLRNPGERLRRLRLRANKTRRSILIRWDDLIGVRE